MIMGDSVLDLTLLSLADIVLELWRVKDWSSYLVIIRLESLITISKFSVLVNEDVG